MKLFTDPNGRVYALDGPPPAGSPFNGGLAFSPTGQVYGANAQPTDTFIGGWRVSILGELVETDGLVPNRPYDFNAGMPQAKQGSPSNRGGALIRQVDNVPAATEPYVAGVRVGPLGGMYQTTSAPIFGNAPVNTVRPAMTGVNSIGSVLSCTTGTWTGDATITYTYQWYQRNTPLIGATSPTYTIQASDASSLLICAVTAKNASGGATAFSNGVVAGAASYNYRNTADQFPPAGFIYHNSPSLNLRIARVDANGVNRSPMEQLNAGDTMTIGPQTGTLANSPNPSAEHFTVSMLAWPQLVDGTYVTTVNVL